MDVGAITRLGILAAVALVLGYVEHLIPVTAIPGVKLGLANTVLLYALYLADTKSTTLLMILKVGLSGVLFGGVAAMLYSFAGGVVSLIIMILVKKLKSVSVVGVSICGAAAHNIGQMAIACFIVETRAVLAYLPVLLLAAVITGALTGIIAKYTFRGLAHGGNAPGENTHQPSAQKQEIKPSKKQG
jgi:heptaprenyl diphosphate synthase